MDAFELKKRRCEKGYFTQTAMAEALGMSKANYGNRERGHIKFTMQEMMKVCEVLGWSLEEGIRYLM